MPELNKLLKLIKLPKNELNFNLIAYNEKGFKSFTELKKVEYNNEYIDCLKYNYRKETEYWKSIDIYITPKKENELVLNFLLKKIDFNNIENNESLHAFKINNTDSVNIIKYENRMIIQITRFIK